MSFSRISAGACLLVLLAGCTEAPRHPALKTADLPPLLQAHRFAWQGGTHRGYQLSPDGSKLAWIGPSMLRSALFVRDVGSGQVNSYRSAASGFHWTPDSRRLVFTNDASGSEDEHVFAIDVADGPGEAVDLTPYPGVRAGIHQIGTGNPDHILVQHNRRDRRVYDLYRIDLQTGEETLVALNPGDAVAPVTTRDGSFQRWQRSREASRPAAERRQSRAKRQPGLLKKPDETFRVLGVGADRSFVWALSDRGRDRVALVVAHPALGWERVVYEHPAVDLDRVLMSRVTQQPLVAYAFPGYPHAEILDDRLRADLASLVAGFGGRPHGMEILSTDQQELRLVVSTYTASQRSYHLVDRARGTHTLLAEALDADFAAALSVMQPVSFPSRDGLRLHGYLTLPRGAEPSRLPMVLLVHGGPWLRTHWGDPLRSEDAGYAQFLANRGYAVLQVDFRGSIGYGRSFRAAAIGEFAGRMQDDLHDGLRWAVDSGIADPARVAVMGWSYGGYAALVGLTRTPGVFACGISLAGPTDLASLIRSFPPYWTTDLSMWHDYVGQPDNPEDLEEMTRKSPLTHAGSLQHPVLIVHGARDVRVRIDQSGRMVDALRRAGKPVEYLAVAEMGHGMGWWPHRLAVLRSTEVFLQSCLGGRASRFDPFDALAWAWTRIKRAGDAP